MSSAYGCWLVAMSKFWRKHEETIRKLVEAGKYLTRKDGAESGAQTDGERKETEM